MNFAWHENRVKLFIEENIVCNGSGLINFCERSKTIPSVYVCAQARSASVLTLLVNTADIADIKRAHGRLLVHTEQMNMRHLADDWPTGSPGEYSKDIPPILGGCRNGGTPIPAGCRQIVQNCSFGRLKPVFGRYCHDTSLVWPFCLGHSQRHEAAVCIHLTRYFSSSKLIARDPNIRVSQTIETHSCGL